ncbi:MAG: tetratricopeptide repeat protein, partial [Bdellovibrionales bacterium]|nr:tetratricopeptide repeat protein [Bdellovibrionales bacterium]
RPSAEKEFDYKFRIAKAFYYLNKFKQSILEVEEILKKTLSQEQNFSVRLFRANVLLIKKDFAEAMEEFEKLLVEFPERAQKENLGLVVAVAYEDMNEFDKAITTLEKIKSNADDPNFIEIKIKRLKERIANQPGKKKK